MKTKAKAAPVGSTAVQTGTKRPKGFTRQYGWRPGSISWSMLLILIAGLSLILYPSVSSWFSSYNQSQVIRDYERQIDHVIPSAAKQLEMAKKYNEALTAGVQLNPNTNVPKGSGTSADKSLDYWSILTAGKDGMMGRIRIPKIKVDLPIFHGTSDDVLAKGAGHLQGSHLPIGGKGTHSVITAHRGLANATMFTNLNKVKKGDTFSTEVFGRVLTYRVFDIRVVDPNDSSSLRAQPGKDLMTLVTCTPLGINTHRILVTGERVHPTPQEDLDAKGKGPDIPRFPWWAVIIGGSILILSAYMWRAGYADSAARARRKEAIARKKRESSNRLEPDGPGGDGTAARSVVGGEQILAVKTPVRRQHWWKDPNWIAVVVSAVVLLTTLVFLVIVTIEANVTGASAPKSTALTERLHAGQTPLFQSKPEGSHGKDPGNQTSQKSPRELGALHSKSYGAHTYGDDDGNEKVGNDTDD